MKNLKLASKISIIVIFILTLGLIILWKSTDSQISSVMKAQILEEMSDAANMQSEIVQQYVEAAELYLKGYGQSTELKAALLNPDKESIVETAQGFTDDYVLVNENLENIYLADYNSTVIASGVKAVNGKTLREGDSLEQLRNNVFASHEIWNVGVMASLSTGKQVVSLYYPIYNDGDPLGYVGGAIYAESLKNTLDNLSNDPDNKTNYALLDAANNTYIFCAEEDMIGTTIENPNILEVVNLARTQQNDKYYYEYRENNKEMLAVYRYIPDRDWVLVILTDCDVAFAPINKMSLILIIMCVVILLVVSIFVWVSVKLIAKDIEKVAQTIHEIGTLDLTIKSKLDVYSSRKDEVGLIAKATMYLTETISDAIRMIKEKNEQLLNTSGTLSSGVTVTTDSIYNMEKAINEISKNVVQQAEDTKRAADTVMHIGETIENTKKETETLHEYTDNIQKASEEMRSTVKKLFEVNSNTEVAMGEIGSQILSTNESAMKIKDAAQLITSIADETNLLSLNASIEAARVGEMGKGFAVVANQIQKLAEQSNESAKYIEQIINVLFDVSGQAVESMQKTKEVILEQSRQLSNTERQFTQIYQDIEVTKKGASAIYTTVKAMNDERVLVEDIVRKLSGIAQENAASSQETLASTEMLKEMVNDISNVSGELSVVSNDIERSVSSFTV